ncbi:hypothetical protein [Nicoliella lavandulae]|uniref:Uncharacterized protein n=1 Tax=Nicoliella lavandulae TaxID=3082954 RepID=A0ABU8SM99_9LACO
MTKLAVSTRGYFLGYRTKVIFPKITFDTREGWDMTWEVTSTDAGDATSNTVTISNLSKKHQSMIKVGDPIELKTGPTDLYGTLVKGTVTNISASQDGTDSTFTIIFQEARGYVEAGKIYNKFNGTKTVSKTSKTPSGKLLTYKKKQVKKLNIAFKKGSTAKQIITRICSEANFSLRKLKLKENLIYKKGYTLSQKPYEALRSIAKSCGSLLYIRDGKIVIDALTEPNPFNEHIFFSFHSGLLAEPTINNNSGKIPLITIDTLEDPRVKAGSVIYVKSQLLDTTSRVQSVKHSFNPDNGYTMEVTGYGEITS